MICDEVSLLRLSAASITIVAYQSYYFRGSYTSRQVDIICSLSRRAAVVYHLPCITA